MSAFLSLLAYVVLNAFVSFNILNLELVEINMSGRDIEVDSILGESSSFDSSTEDDDVVGFAVGLGLPYQNEPLAPAGVGLMEEGNDDAEEEDCDGISLEDLEAHFEDRTHVNQ